MKKEQIEKKAKEIANQWQEPSDYNIARDDIAIYAAMEMADWALSHQWVSVEDDLPKEGELVMTTFIDNKGKRRYAAGSKKNGAGMQVYGVISPSPFPPVTHWMPIPPLAEEGGEK